MYEAWYNKQNPRNLTESPQSNLGFSANPNVNEGVRNASILGYGFATARLLPAGRQIINTVVNASGDKRLQQNIKRVGNLLAFGTEIATVGLLPALAIEAVKLAVETTTNDIQQNINNINQSYNAQKQGVAVNKFVGVGERLD